ncbi:hypothetical protein D918_02928 [Trichuris suis]|nr:hypothetical protein D918_02928 [Trichuris suis]
MYIKELLSLGPARKAPHRSAHCRSTVCTTYLRIKVVFVNTSGSLNSSSLCHRVLWSRPEHLPPAEWSCFSCLITNVFLAHPVEKHNWRGEKNGKKPLWFLRILAMIWAFKFVRDANRRRWLQELIAGEKS